MPDTTLISVDFELLVLDDLQENVLSSMSVSGVTLEIPMTPDQWAVTTNVDRDEAIQVELWERCRTMVRSVKEIG